MDSAGNTAAAKTKLRSNLRYITSLFARPPTDLDKFSLAFRPPHGSPSDRRTVPDYRDRPACTSHATRTAPRAKPARHRSSSLSDHGKSVRKRRQSLETSAFRSP